MSYSVNDMNDYDSDSDNVEDNEYLLDFYSNQNYNKNISVILDFKEKMVKQPEFICIKNISCGEILKYIEYIFYVNIRYNIKLPKNFYQVNEEQYNIISDLFKNLYLNNYDDTIINFFVIKLYNKMYV
jgi:hypothetical protein